MSGRLAGMAITLIGTVSVLIANTSEAGLIFGSWNARATYPTSAPVLTSPTLPFFGPPTPADAPSQGIRADRIQAQTFDVDAKISVESIYVGYRMNPDAPATLNIRLLEIPDVNATYVNPTVLATASVMTPSPATPGDRYNALRLDWSDPAPLILSPRAGVAGYALELHGQNTTNSPVAWIYRTNNPYPGGRAFMFAGTPPVATDDWVLAITGEEIPEPATVVSFGVFGMVVGAVLRRRRG